MVIDNQHKWLVYIVADHKTREVYVGMTGRTLRARGNNHWVEAGNGSQKRKHRFFRDYRERYGTWPTLELVGEFETKGEARIAEQQYIDKYRTEGWAVFNDIRAVAQPKAPTATKFNGADAEGQTYIEEAIGRNKLGRYLATSDLRHRIASHPAKCLSYSYCYCGPEDETKRAEAEGKASLETSRLRDKYNGVCDDTGIPRTTMKAMLEHIVFVRSTAEAGSDEWYWARQSHGVGIDSLLDEGLGA